MGQEATNTGRHGYRGYTIHAPFGGYHVPVTIQNVYIRNYATQKCMTFLLSVTEDYPGHRFDLRSLRDQLPKIEGVIVASLFILPADSNQRRGLYRDLIGAKASLHCVLENLIIFTEADVERAEEIYISAMLIDSCPKTIDKKHLPQIDGFESFTDTGA